MINEEYFDLASVNANVGKIILKYNMSGNKMTMFRCSGKIKLR